MDWILISVVIGIVVGLALVLLLFGLGSMLFAQVVLSFLPDKKVQRCRQCGTVLTGDRDTILRECKCGCVNI